MDNRVTEVLGSSGRYSFDYSVTSSLMMLGVSLGSLLWNAMRNRQKDIRLSAGQVPSALATAISLVLLLTAIAVT